MLRWLVNASASGTCRVYDGHYLVGNYYQWNAATAGTGRTITSSNASGSVCPKGWKLPSSATSASTIAKGTYVYLLQQYGLASAWNTGSVTGTSPVNGNTYNIALSPLFFVRGGYIASYEPSAPLQTAGSSGSYWSSRSGSGVNNAYNLGFSTRTYPSNNGTRYYGQSLRCLVQTS